MLVAGRDPLGDGSRRNFDAEHQLVERRKSNTEPQETFFADRKFIALPSESSRWGIPGSSYQEIVHYARTRGVRYLLVDRNTHETNQEFVASVESKDLKEIFRKADQELIIYEVVR